MPISEVRAPRRSLVGWLKATPSSETYELFRQRGFELVRYPVSVEFGSQPLSDGFRAAILVQDAKLSNAEFAAEIKANAKGFLDLGCAFIVRPLPKGKVTALRTISSLRLPTAGFDSSYATWFRPQDGEDCPVPLVRLFSSDVPLHEVANFVASFEPGRPLNRQLVISGVNLNREQLSLVQRAFSDCHSVHFAPMADRGLSGVGVYKAHADLIEGDLGPWPQCYFVKLGSREKIYREYRNYQRSVHPYLPYHLAPRLVNDRCCLGAKSGIIVGDFVEESEGLLECAEQARGAAPLAYLFDQTLQNWYRNAAVRNEPLGKLLGKMIRGNVSERRVARAMNLGASMNVSDMISIISDIADSKVLMGPTHGDLHARNIRVRKSDAILIDFYAHQESAPLLFDLASLEASLVVDGFRGDGRLSGDRSKCVAWLDSIRPLYIGDPLKADTSGCHPKDESHWFYNSVRIVRRHALAMEHDSMQYAAALAIAFLRKATKDDNADEPEDTRRAAAYVLAEGLARGIRAARTLIA